MESHNNTSAMSEERLHNFNYSKVEIGDLYDEMVAQTREKQVKFNFGE